MFSEPGGCWWLPGGGGAVGKLLQFPVLDTDEGSSGFYLVLKVSTFQVERVCVWEITRGRGIVGGEGFVSGVAIALKLGRRGN